MCCVYWTLLLFLEVKNPIDTGSFIWFNCVYLFFHHLYYLRKPWAQCESFFFGTIRMPRVAQCSSRFMWVPSASLLTLRFSWLLPLIVLPSFPTCKGRPGGSILGCVVSGLCWVECIYHWSEKSGMLFGGMSCEWGMVGGLDLPYALPFCSGSGPLAFSSSLGLLCSSKLWLTPFACMLCNEIQ